MSAAFVSGGITAATGAGRWGAIHGGPDAGGVPLHDFSTNSNACGPCPEALHAVQAADATHYPEPAYTDLRAALGAFHGVAAHRIVVAGSASEFIHRITAWAARRGGGTVALPAYSYGDYAHAAQAWGLPVVRGAIGAGMAQQVCLHWACEPSSPLGLPDPALAHAHIHTHTHAERDGPQPGAGSEGNGDVEGPGDVLRVLDCAYVPLRLDGRRPTVPNTTWQLWTPNKALGLTGIRAAYAIAPAHVAMDLLHTLQALAPSWPLGAHGVAMLTAWVQPSVQQWLQASLVTLRGWKATQQALCQALGWDVVPGSLANYFVARVSPIAEPALASALLAVRAQGIKLRDAASFGLPGHVRLGVLAPASQQALQQVWQHVTPPMKKRT